MMATEIENIEFNKTRNERGDIEGFVTIVVRVGSEHIRNLSLGGLVALAAQFALSSATKEEE